MNFRSFGAAVAAALAALLGAVPAYAHVTLNPNEGVADKYFRTALRVPHGCKASPTVTVRIKMPDGVLSVKPQVKQGWSIAITRRPLPAPVNSGHGTTISDQVDVVEWHGGPLADAHFDEFGLVMKLPATPNATLWFPTVQECQDGTHRWIEIPAGEQKWQDLKEPAPFIRLRKEAVQ